MLWNGGGDAGMRAQLGATDGDLSRCCRDIDGLVFVGSLQM